MSPQPLGLRPAEVHGPLHRFVTRHPLVLVPTPVEVRTTRYIDAAITQLRTEGHELRDQDAARLSPTQTRELHRHAIGGRYNMPHATDKPTICHLQELVAGRLRELNGLGRKIGHAAGGG